MEIYERANLGSVVLYVLLLGWLVFLVIGIFAGVEDLHSAIWNIVLVFLFLITNLHQIPAFVLKKRGVPSLRIYDDRIECMVDHIKCIWESYYYQDIDTIDNDFMEVTFHFSDGRERSINMNKLDCDEDSIADEIVLRHKTVQEHKTDGPASSFGSRFKSVLTSDAFRIETICKDIGIAGLGITIFPMIRKTIGYVSESGLQAAFEHSETYILLIMVILLIILSFHYRKR